MKLGPATKLSEKKKNQHQKYLTMTSCQQIMMPLSFFRFMANLEQSRNQIPDAWSVKLKLSLIATFYFTKTQKFVTQRTQYCFEQR